MKIEENFNERFLKLLQERKNEYKKWTPMYCDAINNTENPKAWMAIQESLIKVQREIIKSR